MFLTQIVKNKDVKAPNPLNNLMFMSFPFQSHVLLYHSYVIRMSLVCHSHVICMLLVCTSMASLCHSYVLVCHPYVTRMYSYVIRMSLVCTRMSSVCHSYVILPRTLLNMNSKKDNIHNNEVTFTFYEY